MKITCCDVPECVEDWQVELADEVKRLTVALFHLMDKIITKYVMHDDIDVLNVVLGLSHLLNEHRHLLVNQPLHSCFAETKVPESKF